MLIKNRFLHHLSVLISGIFLIFVLYLIFRSFIFVEAHHIDIKGSTYIHQVSKKPYIKELAKDITKVCKTDGCKIQKILNFVTTIPYKVNHSISRSPKNTIKNGYGDCDDKSNLLISLLHSLEYESYFVVVPGHIFTIVYLKEKRFDFLKGLYVNGKKYYILESTAKMSHIGFQIKYKMDEIQAVIEPFKNEKIKIKSLKFDY
ncbi:MAG: transglutaminase domain-containing protein [Campylobacterota bacterium]|nr:transglutaminase domain-containing protein [Campylobacterota bacterium]